MGTSLTPNITSQSLTLLLTSKPKALYASSGKILISLDSTLKTASGNCALASANFSGENTTRLSGGFFRSLMMANFILMQTNFIF